VSAPHDVIVAGAGLAGLALVHALETHAPGQRRILLIDQVERRGNDRTWCYWEATPGPFEPLVAHAWGHLYTHPPDPRASGRTLETDPYRYKMIRAGDLFAFMDAFIAARPHIERVTAPVTELLSDGDHARVRWPGGEAHATWAFDSVHRPTDAPPGYHRLLQHFLGFEIETERECFNPDTATFMDFRVDQTGGTQFVYILPTSRTRALVEYTVFSRDLWPERAYEAPLRAYLRDHHGIDGFTVHHREYGVIPMSDQPFPRSRGRRVITIGTAGGQTKPSTGFTFARALRHADALARSLTQHGHPHLPQRGGRYPWMDAVLLRLLDTGRMRGADFFSHLLRVHPPQRVLAFLDEQSTLADDLAIMARVNVPLFARTGLEIAWRNLRARAR
jgi:lycopene beta-cyclase